MSEQLLNKILEEMKTMKTDIAEMKSTIATKDDLKSVKEELKSVKEELKNDIAKLERLANGSMEIIEKTYQEFEQFSETQELHAVWLRRLAADTAQNEAEISLLKKAK